MNILVNATNLQAGGGVQKAVELVRASVEYPTRHRFCYALSEAVARNLGPVGAGRTLDQTVLTARPCQPLRGRATRQALSDLERRFRPDVVYTVFGPACRMFRSPHLMGFAVPWITHPNSHAWATLRDPLRKARFWAWCKSVAFSTRFADRWVLETQVAADGLARALRLDRRRFHVVPNICSEPYYLARDAAAIPDRRMERRSPSDFNLLVFTAWYPHKNLEIVPRVAAELRRRDATRRYRFFLTFDTASAAWKRIQDQARIHGVEDGVINLGPALVTQGPGLYRAADALFQPTLLESFTATYPEALCTRTPIVTTDLPFARDICDDAALYFPPDDAAGAAERITSLARDEALKTELARKGESQFATFKTPRQVYEMLLEVLEVTARDRGR